MTDELKFIPGKQYPFASPFVDVQKDICMAFGFTISSGCGTVYGPRKAAPKHQSALLTIRGTEHSDKPFVLLGICVPGRLEL